MSINRARARRKRKRERRKERVAKYLRELGDMMAYMDATDPSWRLQGNAKKMMEFVQETMRKGFGPLVQRVVDVQASIDAMAKTLSVSVKYEAMIHDSIVVTFKPADAERIKETA